MRCILLFLISLYAFGAVSYTVPTAAVASTSNATSYPLASFTPPANVDLTIEVCATGTVAAGSITSTAGATLTWTKKISSTNGTDTCYLFWGRTGGSPGASTFAFDCTGDAATGAIVVIKSWANADLTSSDPIAQAVGNNGASSTAPTWTVAARSTNSGYASFFYSTTAPPAVTQPTGWTRDVNTNYSTPTTGFDSASKVTGETSTSITWASNSGTAWRGIAYEVSAPRTSVTENLSPSTSIARSWGTSTSVSNTNVASDTLSGGQFVVQQQVRVTRHYVVSNVAPTIKGSGASTALACAGAGSSSCAVSYSPTAGSSLCAGIVYASGQATATVTDNGSGGSSSYSAVTTAASVNAGSNFLIWYCTASTASGVTTITADKAQSIVVVEWTGAGITVDQQNNTPNLTTGTTNWSSSATSATTNASAVALSLSFDTSTQDSGWTGTNGYTCIAGPGNGFIGDGFTACYKSLSSTGAQTATGTVTNADAVYTIITVFH